MTPLPISSSNFYQPNIETCPLTPHDTTTTKEMSRSHANDEISSLNTAYHSGFGSDLDSFNNTHSYNTIVTNYSDYGTSWGVKEERSEITAWLSPLDPRFRHQDIRTRRADNVGEWRMRTDEFQSWCDGAQPEGSGLATLFCCGDPGAGKTYFT